MDEIMQQLMDEKIHKSAPRDNWKKSDLYRMIDSNTKLVDENRTLKRDVLILVGFLTGSVAVEKEAVENVLNYYKDKNYGDIGGMKGEIRDE